MGTHNSCERRPEATGALQVLEEEESQKQIKFSCNAVDRYYTLLRYDSKGPEDREDMPMCPRCKQHMSPLDGDMCMCVIDDMHTMLWDIQTEEQLQTDVYLDDDLCEHEEDRWY